MVEKHIKTKLFIRGDQTESEISPEDRQEAKLVTFCVLILADGHKVTGVSFANDKAHYDEVEAKKWTYEDALNRRIKKRSPKGSCCLTDCFEQSIVFYMVSYIVIDCVRHCTESIGSLGIIIAYHGCVSTYHWDVSIPKAYNDGFLSSMYEELIVTVPYPKVVTCFLCDRNVVSYEDFSLDYQYLHFPGYSYKYKRV